MLILVSKRQLDGWSLASRSARGSTITSHDVLEHDLNANVNPRKADLPGSSRCCSPHGFNQVVDRAGRDALDVRLLDDHVQRFLKKLPGIQEDGKIAACP
jgi:hypothetical protein